MGSSLSSISPASLFCSSCSVKNLKCWCSEKLAKSVLIQIFSFKSCFIFFKFLQRLSFALLIQKCILVFCGEHEGENISVVGFLEEVGAELEYKQRELFELFSWSCLPTCRKVGFETQPREGDTHQ